MKVRRLLEAVVLAALLVFAFAFPATSGTGFREALLALLFPLLLMEAVYRDRSWAWIWMTFGLGLAGIFHWVPATLASKAPMPYPLGLLGGVLFYAYEGLGFTAVALGARAALRRGGPFAAGAAAGLGLLLWEVLGWHIYTWSYGAPFGALPWVARSAAFLGAHGLGALAWASGALGAAWLVGERGRGRAALPPAILLGLMVLLSLAWHLLPRGPRREADVVMIQPNFEPGLRVPGMEEADWAQTDALLAEHRLPRAGTPTLVLWPESAVLGRDDRGPDPRLTQEAARRGVAWLYGTEGGAYNLVRGEAPGRPPYLAGKIEPMAFGERMPGPEPLSRWLDRVTGFPSQHPFPLPERPFEVPGSQGALRVLPLVCSDALLPGLVRRAVTRTGAELLTNHTNDGWFDRSQATDLHGAQIRLRAVETGLPLLRATLTGRSGLFREDGSWVLWGGPMTRDAYAFTISWRPVRTPARSPWVLPGLMLLLALGTTAGVVLRR